MELLDIIEEQERLTAAIDEISDQISEAEQKKADALSEIMRLTDHLLGLVLRREIARAA